MICSRPKAGFFLCDFKFGLLQHPLPVSKMNQKMSSYMKHGYIPFKNLICTFEPDIKNTDLLRSLIENIILEVYN